MSSLTDSCFSLFSDLNVQLCRRGGVSCISKYFLFVRFRQNEIVRVKKRRTLSREDFNITQKNHNKQTNKSEEKNREKVTVKMFRTNYVENSCLRCTKTVYPTDKIGPLKDFTFFHSGCFRCVECSTKLTLKTYFNNQVRTKTNFVITIDNKPSRDFWLLCFSLQISES